MLSTKKKNLLNIKFRRLYYCKFKLKYLLLKSIYNNRNTNSNCRLISKLYINQKKYINNNYYNICRFSWYKKSVNKKLGYGRHELNRQGILGNLQNVSINSW